MGALTPWRSTGMAEGFRVALESFPSSGVWRQIRGKRTEFIYYPGMFLWAGFSLLYGVS